MLRKFKRWLRRLFKRPNYQDPYIFTYPDGTNQRYVDPIVVEESLIDSLGDDWRDVVAKLDQPSPLGLVGEDLDVHNEQRRALTNKVYDAIQKAFDLRDFAFPPGGRAVGLIRPLQLAVLNGYMLFTLDLVRLSRPSEPVQSQASPSRDDRPLPSGQGSTSADVVSPRNDNVG